LDAEGNAEAAQEARWRLFERTLSEEVLKALLARLPDFEDVIALERAFEIASTFGDAMKALAFLMNWPAHREAAAMILARRAELRGFSDDLPLWAGRLSARHPDAAVLLVRTRAIALARLGEDLPGLVGEAEALAARASDPELPSHETFLADLRSASNRRAP
jgi:hypothetical protein